MTQKKRLSADERYGLSDDEIAIAERYLKKHGLQAVMDKVSSTPMFEMFVLGYSYEDIFKAYPNVPKEKLILTSAINRWNKDKEMLANSVLDRIKARIVRSTIEQVDMLTSLISVYNVETTEEVKRYLLDPVNNPPPSNRINNIKDLQRVIEMLADVTSNVKSMATPTDKSKVVSQKKTQKQLIQEKDEHTLLAELVEEDEE